MYKLEYDNHGALMMVKIEEVCRFPPKAVDGMIARLRSPGLRLAKGGAGGGAMIGGRLGRADLEFAPFPHRHCAFAAQDIAPHLDQFIDGYVRQSAVVIAENRGVEAAVLAVGGDDGMVRAVVDGDPVDQDLVALFQIVFEPGKGADARPPAAPGLDVAPD